MVVCGTDQAMVVCGTDHLACSPPGGVYGPHHVRHALAMVVCGTDQAMVVCGTDHLACSPHIFQSLTEKKKADRV